MNNTIDPPSPATAPTTAPARTRSKLRAGWIATHATLSLTGLAVLLVGIGLATQAQWRQQLEEKALGWLLARQESLPVDESLITPDLTAIERVTAASPSDLPKPQANVALWLSRRYRVAPEPLSVLVSEAFQIGSKLKLDPTLILAVMAIESRFNPYAQSPMGAQGLMQVLTRVHTDKYESFGGTLAAFDPVSNLRVGAQILHDAVRKAGSIEGGLKLYVGAVTTDGSGYINKVMAEHLRLQSVALGKPMPKEFPLYVPPTAAPTVDPLPQPAAAPQTPLDNAPELDARPADAPALVAATPPG
jgi:hypothetical protein